MAVSQQQTSGTSSFMGQYRSLDSLTKAVQLKRTSSRRGCIGAQAIGAAISTMDSTHGGTAAADAGLHGKLVIDAQPTSDSDECRYPNVARKDFSSRGAPSTPVSKATKCVTIMGFDIRS